MSHPELPTRRARSVILHTPASHWELAYPLGNGHLGIMTFGGAAAIAEMLLQSQEGCLHLLPACPRDWPTGAFTGFRARGGFTVDLSWKEERFLQLVIQGTPGSEVAVRIAADRFPKPKDARETDTLRRFRIPQSGALSLCTEQLAAASPIPDQAATM